MTATWTVDVPESPASTRWSSVHVVTVTHNSASTLDAYFEGIDACSSEIAGVTVVDNASTDDSVAQVRAAAARSAVPVFVVENENTGFAGGYAAAARSPLGGGLPVLALNPDVALSAGAVEAMLSALNAFPAAGVVTVPLVEFDGTPDTASRRRLPRFSSSILYSLLGRFTPSRLRYNARTGDDVLTALTDDGLAVSQLEATTGAVMLVPPDFRTLEEGVFDRDYWMYGEDLQLCVDAAGAGRLVLMAEVEPSVHTKGVSSGRPRSRRSNRAFHDAMRLYAEKNLVQHPALRALVRAGVESHFLLSELQSVPARVRRRLPPRL